MKKKVLFVNSSLSGGGSERVMTLLANQMARDGYDVVMILCIHNEEVYKLDESVKNYYLTECKGKGITMRWTRLRALRAAIKNEKPDVVISFMSQINMYSLIATMGLKCKMIVSERADPKQRSIIHRIIENILYTFRADKIVFQTEYVKDSFIPLIRKKSIVILNPIDVSALPLYSGKREKCIAGIGRLTEQKNFALLIEAFIAFDKINDDYTLHIYGEGPLLNQLKHIVLANNMSEKIFFHGYVTNIAECVYKYNMYISTSNYEGISNAMLEVMAMGIPTICTDCPVGGARTIIKNCVNGLLVPMDNKEELVNAMLRIERDERLAQILSKMAVQVGEKLELKRITEEWERLMEGI